MSKWHVQSFLTNTGMGGMRMHRIMRHMNFASAWAILIPLSLTTHQWNCREEKSQIPPLSALTNRVYYFKCEPADRIKSCSDDWKRKCITCTWISKLLNNNLSLTRQNEAEIRSLWPWPGLGSKSVFNVSPKKLSQSTVFPRIFTPLQQPQTYAPPPAVHCKWNGNFHSIVTVTTACDLTLEFCLAKQGQTNKWITITFCAIFVNLVSMPTRGRRQRNHDANGRTCTKVKESIIFCDYRIRS